MIFNDDGAIDTFISVDNLTGPNAVLFNDGAGRMVSSNLFGGLGYRRGSDTGDLDGDGDLDIVLAHGRWDPDNRSAVTYLNDGTGVFTEDERFGDSNWNNEELAVADLDGDFDLDVYLGVGAGPGGPDMVYLNRSCPDVEIVKTASTNPVVAGTPLTYTVTVSNLGPEGAVNVRVADVLPMDVSPNGVILTNFGDMAVGSSTSFQFAVDVLSSALGAITNNAGATNDLLDADGSNNQVALETVVITVADLQVSGSDSVDPVIAGTSLDYSVTVTNAGPSDALAVNVISILPAGVTPSGVITSSVGTLAAGDSTTVFTGVSVDAGTLGLITNTVMISSTTSDSEPLNNSVDVITEVLAEADLEIGLMGMPDPVVAGEGLTYTLSVTNHGPSDAVNVVVTNDVPSSLFPSGPIVFPVGTLPAGTGFSTAGVLTVNSDVIDPIVNVGYILSDTPDPVASNNMASAVTAVERHSDLVLVKTAPTSTVAGTSISYTLSVTNSGPSDADDVTIYDQLPPGLDQMGVVSNIIGGMVSGASTSVTIQANVDPSLRNNLTNQASVASSNLDPNSLNNLDSVETVVRAEVDLEITPVGLPASVVAGTGLSYDFTIVNQGPSDATRCSGNQSVAIRDDTSWFVE